MHKLDKILALLLLSNLAVIYPKDRQVTVFVHGTLFPIMDYLVHEYDCPIGLTIATDLKNRLFHSKIGHILNESSKSQFPIATTYIYGWSGKLSFEARERAAADLFSLLEQFKEDNLTIIGHSHGCNVALNLAKIASDKKDDTFKIDRLILLAGPVQEKTKNLVASPYFKRVYSFYSDSDYIQVLDPQGIYRKDNRGCRKKRRLFSQRIYPYSTNLIQSQVMFNGRNLWHIDFILEKFIMFMPKMLEGLESVWKNHLDRINPIEINLDSGNKLLFIVNRYNAQNNSLKKYNIIENNNKFIITDLFDN